jgi:protein-S-isoprenylcysteine O-methyltransferase Ste14
VIWVVAQTALMVSILLSWLFEPRPHGPAVHIVGWVLIALGLALTISTRIAMGRSFTVLPEPRAGAELVTRGPFRIVRNPMYFGVLLLFGGASLNRNWIGLGLTVALGLLWAGKVRVEERHLDERFPEYEDYRRRVRYRLVPFVY